jgi:hydrogenase maturation protein HypF
MERRAIVVRGIVQGVGFRPYVYNLAARLQLHGFVKNQTGSLLIEIEGDSPSLDSFVAALTGKPPPLAQIEQVSWEPRDARGERQFRIEPSDADAAHPVFISPDIAVCPDCLKELLDPADRRHGYPFLNCTNCGPRLTIITGAPYDRERTTMAAFPMCPACRAEYDNPTDRRFHAQPTTCARCGPGVRLLEASGKPIEANDPIAGFGAALLAGKIGALKGLGGYHLVCDARNHAGVAELRRRKHRDEKPFAIMVRDADAAAELCELDETERELLRSPRAPIVLLRKRPGGTITEEVAPRNPLLGILLPYTPLHHLLLRAVGDVPLVMTSGNRSDEPIAYQDAEARQHLGDIADLFLVHNRPIHVRCDDSVLRVLDGVELPIRRSRGYAPQPITLPRECPQPILAVGGQLKVTFALGRQRQAFLSQHMGDLDHFEAYQAFVKDIVLFQQLFGVGPRVLAHDSHPDYATTRYVLERSAAEGSTLLGIQHHHAHMASCMAEHGLAGPVIGVSFDGSGFGTDGAIWGGEFLVGDYQSFRRAAHLRYVGMPGGDQAIREPWRMALAHLVDARILCSSLAARVSQKNQSTIRRMLERRFNTPLTSSVGRLFDAVAALAGVRDRVHYEGQAAIELEWLATQAQPDGSYPFDLKPAREAEAPLSIDTRPLVAAVVRDVNQGIEPTLIARRFHTTLVEVIATVAGKLRNTTGLSTVVLSGGVFLNGVLTRETMARLRQEGFEVYRHRRVPPNDGGLSLGQLAIAARRLSAD